jgi:hypothetical protein
MKIFGNLVTRRWNLGLLVAFDLRNCAVYYHHRNTIRKTTFQNGRSGSVSIWKNTELKLITNNIFNNL